MTWFDDNQTRAWPLVGDDDYAIAHDVLVDVMVHAPDSLGGQAAVTSISVTGLVVSVVISIDGTPAGYVTVPNTPDLVHAPQELQPIASGISGTVTFGDGVLERRLRVDGTYDLVDEALISFPVDLSTPTAVLRGTDLFGRVALEAGEGITITAEELRVRKEDLSIVTTTVAAIALDAESRLVPINPCEVSAEAGDLPTTPVREINGVPPDGAGDIDLVALTIQRLPTDGTVSITATEPGEMTFTDTAEPCE